MSRILNIKDGRRSRKDGARLRQYTFNTKAGDERVSIVLSDWPPAVDGGDENWGLADINAWGGMGGTADVPSRSGVVPKVVHYGSRDGYDEFVTIALGGSVRIYLSGEQAQQLAESLTRD